MILAAVLAVVVAAGAVVGGILLLHEPAPAVGSQAAAPTSVVPAGSAPTYAASTSTPRQHLDETVAADRALVEQVVGAWVPQIGSKTVGTAANGTVYDEATIWADYQAAKSRYPDAVLLRSDDFTSFKRGGFWVIVVATPFGSGAAANSWCENAGLGPDDCFAKRLSHSEGPSGNTMPR